MAVRRRHPSKFEATGDEINRILIQELDPNVENQTTIFDYQIKAAHAAKNYYDKAKGSISPPAIIVAPTGSGKSGIVTLLPYVLKSEKVMIISPSSIISDQLAKAFGNCGVEHAFIVKTKLISKEEDQYFIEHPVLISATKNIPSMDLANLVIVNAQKFGGNSNMRLMNGDELTEVNKYFQAFSTIIVDEAHHYPARTWENIVKNFHAPGKHIIFLTATPFRGTGSNIKPILGNEQKIVFKILKSEIEGRTIRRSEFRIMELQDVDPYKQEIGIPECLICQIGETIRGYLQEHDLQHPSVMHKAMILVSDTADASDIASLLGDDATFVTSERITERNLARFEKDVTRVRILLVCGKLLEGYDYSNVSVCVILRKVKSPIVFAQFIGRCLRMSSTDDPVRALVLTLEAFDQAEMWQNYNKQPVLPEEDPNDE